MPNLEILSNKGVENPAISNPSTITEADPRISRREFMKKMDNYLLSLGVFGLWASMISSLLEKKQQQSKEVTPISGVQIPDRYNSLYITEIGILTIAAVTLRKAMRAGAEIAEEDIEEVDENDPVAIKAAERKQQLESRRKLLAGRQRIIDKYQRITNHDKDAMEDE